MLRDGIEATCNNLTSVKVSTSSSKIQLHIDESITIFKAYFVHFVLMGKCPGGLQQRSSKEKEKGRGEENKTMSADDIGIQRITVLGTREGDGLLFKNLILFLKTSRSSLIQIFLLGIKHQQIISIQCSLKFSVNSPFFIVIIKFFVIEYEAVW